MPVWIIIAYIAGASLTPTVHAPLATYIDYAYSSERACKDRVAEINLRGLSTGFDLECQRVVTK